MTVLVGGTLIDGTGRDPQSGVSVTIEGDRITAVGAQPSRSDEVIDLDGCTILPGLIDAHTHLGIISPFEERIPPAVDAAYIFRNCREALEAGFTTVRDLGGLDGGVVEAINLGLVAGPRIFPSGPVICQTGGHSDLGIPWAMHHHQKGVPGLAQLSLVSDGVEAIRTSARKAFQRGATQLKVCVSGGVLSFTDRLEDTQFTVEELAAAVSEAKARGTYVAAHAHGVDGIRNAIEAGIGSIEHGTFIDAETAVLMAERGVAFVPTFAVVRVLMEEWKERGIPEQMIPRLNGIEESMAHAVKHAQEAGVLIGSGSDLFGKEQAKRGVELTVKAEIVGAMDAITSATRDNAKILRMDGSLGTIEEGKTADVVAVAGDPMADPKLFSQPENVLLVIKEGSVAKQAV